MSCYIFVISEYLIKDLALTNKTHVNVQMENTSHIVLTLYFIL